MYRDTDMACRLMRRAARRPRVDRSLRKAPLGSPPHIIALWSALLAGSGYALAVTAILYVNQFPDRRADALAGKRHWVVRFGPVRAAALFPALIGAVYALQCLAVASGALPWPALAVFVLAPLWRQIAERHGLRVPDLNALIGLSWQYADATFASQRPFPVPPLVSTIALRQAGFGACIDTEDCILQHLQAMQAQGYLPGGGPG